MTTAACLVAALITAAGTPARGRARKDDADRERAVALWEEAIRAKGGRERLQSVQNFLVSSTILAEASSGGGITESERLYALPGKAWLYELTSRFDVTVDATVINFERKLCRITISPARAGVPPVSFCPPTTWAARLIQDPVIYLMETRWVRPVPVRARTEGEGGRRLDVVETEVGDLRVDFFLDRRSRLPIKLVTDHYYGVTEATQRMGLTVTLDDYAEVDGIQMPRRVIRRPELGPQVTRRHTERARYSFNVAHDETIFDHPASRKVKSDDWKPRRDE